MLRKVVAKSSVRVPEENIFRLAKSGDLANHLVPLGNLNMQFTGTYTAIVTPFKKG
jgi:hypothetical protein